MAGAGASARIYGILVELTDTLGPDFEVSGYLNRFCALSAELLDVSATAVLLTGGRSGIDLAALHGEHARDLVRHELDQARGPAFDCHRTGRPGACDDFSAPAAPWPALGRTAAACGIAAEHALPLRWREQTAGVLVLLSAVPGALAGDRLALASSMASAAASGLLHHQSRARQTELAGDLRAALDDAAPVEQAKGMLAERLSIDVAQSLVLLGEYAWAQFRSVSDVAADVVAGRLEISGEPLLTAFGATRSRQDGHQAATLLHAHPTTPKAARDFVAKVLRSWGLTRHLDTACLLTSELVTNAVRHGRGPVELRVSRRGPETVIEVRDQGPGRVRRSAGPAGDVETGRGLTIVERLADRWGVAPAADGKTVWFVLSDDAMPAW